MIIIPELDDEAGGDADQRSCLFSCSFFFILSLLFALVVLVAHAPRNVHRRIPTLDELSSDSKHSIISISEVNSILMLFQNLNVFLGQSETADFDQHPRTRFDVTRG
jgi:hypothetical protein